MNYLIEIVNDTLKGFNFVNGMSYTAFTNTRSIEIKFHGKNPVNGAYIFRINKNAYEALVKTNGFIGNDTTYKNQNSPFNPGIKDGSYYIKYLMDYTHIAYDVIAKLLYSPLDINYNPYRESVPEATNQEATLSDPYDIFIDLTDSLTDFNSSIDESTLSITAFPNFVTTTTLKTLNTTVALYNPVDLATDPLYGVDATVSAASPISVTIDKIATQAYNAQYDVTGIIPGTGYTSGQIILLTIEFTESEFNTKKYITYPYIFQAP
jgi:hypothetical protein